MSQDMGVFMTPEPSAARRPQAYPGFIKTIHWIVAILVVAVPPVGFMAARLDNDPLQDRLLFWHESFGFVIFVLGLVWALWRLSGARPPRAPVLSPLELAASRTAQQIMLALLVATPIVGWFGASAAGFDVDIFGLFQMPAALAKDEELGDQIFALHMACAILLGLAVLAHIVGAIVHMERRDGVAARMWLEKKP